MKKSISISILCVLSIMVDAQGFIGFTIEEVKKEVGIDYVVESGINEDGGNYITLNNEYYEWILFLNVNNVVYHSKFICKTIDSFKFALDVLNTGGSKGVVKSGDGHWVVFLGSGVIDIKTEMTNFSDIPVFYYNYVSY